MVKTLKAAPSLFQENHKRLKEWKYIEDPTYSRSIGSHVCVNCSKFDYSSQVSYYSIFCCNWHQKIISEGQHLTHSCESYQKKAD